MEEGEGRETNVRVTFAVLEEGKSGGEAEEGGEGEPGCENEERERDEEVSSSRSVLSLDWFLVEIIKRER